MPTPKSPPLPVLLGQHIRAAREARGLSQRELAGLVGIEATHLSRIENGHGENGPSAGLVDRIARALGVEPGALFPSSQTT